MKKTILLSSVLCLVISCLSFAETVVFHDDFDDGNYNGWTISNPGGGVASAPDVVVSPEGYSLRGVGNGYSQDPGLNVWISQPVSIQTSGYLKIEMRAKSGPEWPNNAVFYLFSGNDNYFINDYGEANKRASFRSLVDGIETNFWHNIGEEAYEWHTFTWIRDIDGWWSLDIDIDGFSPVNNWFQDDQLNSFDYVGIHLLRDQSEIEWVTVSVPEPTTLLLLGLGGLVLRRKQT